MSFIVSIYTFSKFFFHFFSVLILFFLKLKNIIETDVQRSNKRVSTHNDLEVEFQDASFSWISNTEQKSNESIFNSNLPVTESPSVDHHQTFYLHDMNVKFPIGGISVICGRTGSGKTSMIMALLGGKTNIFRFFLFLLKTFKK